MHADDGCAQQSLRLLAEILTQAAATGVSDEGHGGVGESEDSRMYSEGRDNSSGAVAVNVVGAWPELTAMWHMTATQLLPQVSPSYTLHGLVPNIHAVIFL